MNRQICTIRMIIFLDFVSTIKNENVIKIDISSNFIKNVIKMNLLLPFKKNYCQNLTKLH